MSANEKEGFEQAVVDVNPDAMSRGELIELREALCQLAEYCNCKINAMACRESGHIQDAIAWEKTCDHRYAELPQIVKSW